jgi:hypothetical protein
MKSNPLPALAAACAAILLAAANAAAQSAGDDGPQVALKIDLVSWGADLRGLALGKGGKHSGLTALAFRYSETIRYSGPQALEIFQDPNAASQIDGELLAAMRRRAAEDGIPLPAEFSKGPANPAAGGEPRLIARTVLPAASRHVTILLAPGRDGTFQTHVIDDDPARLPYGRLRILNYSPHLVALRCNGKAARELKPKEAFIVVPENGQVIYELGYHHEGAWQMQENNLIPVSESDQVQFIILRSDADFFASSDGSRAGFLQSVVLRRPRVQDPP